MKAYVLMQKGYEYNDEINNPTEGGHPTKIFFSKKDAEEKVIELNINEFKQTNLEEYTYDMEDICSDVDSLKEYVKSLNEKYGVPTPKNKWDRPDEYRLNAKATEEEGKKYASMVDITFYEISTVDVDVASFRDFKIDEILPIS